ncbi:GerW family sporulation protein [Selenomonadales bacterium OttesenSCG-928-I06]|nr:GerW family sporulation protein [Selenomonadales bacterium OttesenSCG-928-I06]
MAEHPIQDLMKTAMDSIKNMVDANTIIGDTITAPDGTIIIPISRVAFGFAAGGSDHAPAKDPNQDTPFGGGSGAGITVKPIGFLVCSPTSGVRFMTTENSASSDKILDMIPWIFEKINKYLNKKEDDCEENDPFERVDIED